MLDGDTRVEVIVFNWEGGLAGRSDGFRGGAKARTHALSILDGGVRVEIIVLDGEGGLVGRFGWLSKARHRSPRVRPQDD